MAKYPLFITLLVFILPNIIFSQDKSEFFPGEENKEIIKLKKIDNFAILSNYYKNETLVSKREFLSILKTDAEAKNWYNNSQVFHYTGYLVTFGGFYFLQDGISDLYQNEKSKIKFAFSITSIITGWAIIKASKYGKQKAIKIYNKDINYRIEPSVNDILGVSIAF